MYRATVTHIETSLINGRIDDRPVRNAFEAETFAGLYKLLNNHIRSLTTSVWAIDYADTTIEKAAQS